MIEQHVNGNTITLRKTGNEFGSTVSSSSSVGKGPLPTRVQYALKIPITFPILLGAIPKPVQAPAHIVLEDVTKG